MKFKNKNERRQFLKKASAAGIGLGVAVTGLAKTDPVFARLGNKMTEDHVNQVIAQIKQASPNESAPLAYIQTTDNIKQLVDRDKDPGAIETMSMVEEFLNGINQDDYGLDEEGLLNLPLSLSDALVGAYLAGVDQLNFGEYGPNELRRSFKKVKKLEPDFLANFVEKIQYEKETNPEFKRKFDRLGYPSMQEIIERTVSRSSNDKLMVSVGVFIAIVVLVCLAFVLITDKK